MKVKLASQVFSHSVAAGIFTNVALNGLPSEAAGTAELIERIDKIFDCANSSSSRSNKFSRRPISITSSHVTDMTEGIQFFKSLKIINDATGQDRTSSLKCITGWCLTLNAMISLWRKLYDEGAISFLATRRLNQDPLENFFGAIRQQGGNSDNPTAIQFKRAYRKLFHTNLLTIASGNCETDKDKPLVELGNLQGFATSLSEPNDNASQLMCISNEYRAEQVEEKLIKKNAVAYVAGYLLRKTFLKHKCPVCESALTDQTESYNETKTFLLYKAYDSDSSIFGGLVVPSESMMSYVVSLEDKFVEYFRNLKKVNSIGGDLLQLLKKDKLDSCEFFDSKYMLLLFTRMRIYYCLKFANRTLQESKRKNRKYMKVVHL